MPLTFERDAVRFGAAAARKKKSNENQFSTCFGRKHFPWDPWRVNLEIHFFFFLRGVSHTFYTRMEETMSSATSGRNNGRIEWHLYHAERYRTSSFLFWFLMALAAAAWGSRNNNQMLLLLCIRERWRHRWRMLSRSAILVVGRTVWRECCSRGTGPSTHQTTTPAAHAHTRLLRFFFSK